jgi:hypothetical protein
MFERPSDEIIDMVWDLYCMSKVDDIQESKQMLQNEVLKQIYADAYRTAVLSCRQELRRSKKE